MVENKKWEIYPSIISDPDFDRVICEINVYAPNGQNGGVGFLSCDNGDDDIRIHLSKFNNIPLPLLLEGIEEARKALLEEE